MHTTKFSGIGALACLCLSTLAASCSSPVMGSGGSGGLSLTFLISGAPQGRADGARLLLPSANRLTVRLTPNMPDVQAPAPSNADILPGQRVATAVFSNLPMGRYTIEAVASYEGIACFSRTVDAVLGTGQNSLGLNLLPVSETAFPELAGAGSSHGLMTPGTCRTWTVPASSLIGGRFECYVNAAPGLLLFIQRGDGTPVPLDPTLRHTIAAVPGGDASYVTLFNGSGADIPFTLEFNLPTIISARGMAMVPVPGGLFQRDSGTGNLSRVGAFLMGKYEVTQAQWQAIASDSYPSGFLDPNYPAAALTFYDMAGFCNRLSLAEGLQPVYTIMLNTMAATPWDGSTFPVNADATYGKVFADFSKNGYRLPTEMEWMWAAMGADGAEPGQPNLTGYGKAFAGDSGGAVLGDYAWTSADGSAATAVGSQFPNELGIYDLSGNVFDACWDKQYAWPSNFLANYRLAPSGLTNYIVRGGSYSSSAGTERIDSRASQPTSPGFPALGFRVARGTISANRFVFTSNTTDNTISAFVADPASGALYPQATSAGFGGSPKGLAAHPSGKYLLAVCDQTTVRSLSIDPFTGALAQVNNVTVASGLDSVRIRPSGTSVYVANIAQGSVQVFGFDPATGMLSAGHPSVYPGSVPMGLDIDPAGVHLYVVLYNGAGPGSYVKYDIDAATGNLLDAAPTPFFQYSNGIAVHPSGGYVYITEGNGPGIDAFKRNDADGSLALLDPVSHFPCGWPDYPTMDPLGAFLFYRNAGIRGFAIDQATGTLSPLLSGNVLASAGVRTAMDPAGQFLYVLDESANEARAFRVARPSGGLTQAGDAVPTGAGSGAGSIAVAVVP